MQKHLMSAWISILQKIKHFIYPVLVLKKVILFIFSQVQPVTMASSYQNLKSVFYEKIF